MLRSTWRSICFFRHAHPPILSTYLLFHSQHTLPMGISIPSPLPEKRRPRSDRPTRRAPFSRPARRHAHADRSLRRIGILFIAIFDCVDLQKLVHRAPPAATAGPIHPVRGEEAGHCGGSPGKLWNTMKPFFCSRAQKPGVRDVAGRICCFWDP